MKTFSEKGDFKAVYAAENWLKENGYSVGIMQAGSPRGILKGYFMISKWRNLSTEEQDHLDGTMDGDMRNGPVTITIKEFSETHSTQLTQP